MAPKLNATQREKGYVLLPQQPSEIIVGLQVRVWEKKVSTVSELESNLSGRIAYPGRVSGRVRVILSTKELHQVRKGEILVTPSTTPAYVPILNKVKAIVVEEGGVLSHASVISRELKIPCLIGVLQATKILKNHMRIEVDADQGVVRKLVA